MLAAHIVARRFERVILVERGHTLAGEAPRRSVPQERHVHMLLQRGKMILEELLPGFTAELERRGAVVADASRDVELYHRGRWKRRFATGIETHYCTRGLIDQVIRERVLANPRTELRSGARVLGLLREGDALERGGVTGVLLDTGERRDELRGGLVIDASGRSSLASRWLVELGCERPRISEVTTRLGYGTQLFRRLPEYEGAWKALLVMPTAPATRRMGVVSPIEGGRWMVTTGGWLGECPGGSDAEFLEFLRSLPDPAIYDVIRRATPLSKVAIFRMPGGMRRHFEELERWPGRFLTIGDAVCSLNPIYGQGMTVGALEAEALAAGLDDLLDAGTSPLATRALQRRIVAQVDVPWQMAQAEDLRYPQVPGARGWKLRLQHAYGGLVADASAIDGVICKRLLEVINLVTPPEQLAAPAFQTRVLATAARLHLGRLTYPASARIGRGGRPDAIPPPAS
jgi:2-polyprenyl-6-methoxyphenol hydroxylase-like FAD-dependent oxidoreductase